jgi:hypothetical protein
MAKYQPGAETGNSSATGGWVGAETFKEALEKINVPPSATVTPADVTDGMHALGPNFTLGGNMPPTTFAPGKPATQQSCGWYIKVSGGKLVTPLGSGMICQPS